MQSNYSKKISSLSPCPNKIPKITEKDFEQWTAKNLYRSSYHDMHKKTPVKSKNYAIPGYCGHIPGSADNNYGKRFTVNSREQLYRDRSFEKASNELFPQRPSSISPLSFQKKFGGGTEEEYQTISRFYGKSTIPFSHPNYSYSEWSTNYKNVYLPQESCRSQLQRKSGLEFWQKTKVSDKAVTKASGFAKNSALFDGTGWKPSVPEGDMKTTEYRGRFTPDLVSHKIPKRNLRRLHKKKLDY